VEFCLLYCVYKLIVSESDILVEFDSPSYTGSESLQGVPVTLVITQGTIDDGRNIKVDIIPTNHYPVSAEGMYHIIK